MKPEVDPKRTGVKAHLIEFAEPPMHLEDGRWYGPLGCMVRVEAERGGYGLLIGCPGCGQLGGAKDTTKWVVTEGSIDDVATLSLLPSILKGCCGWHGYLKQGTFESC